MYLYCTYLSTVSSAAIYTSIIYLNRFHGSTIPGHHPHQPSTHPRATPAIIHSTQSHTLLQYHSLRSSINQSPSPPPNSFASLTTPFPPIPRLPRIAPVFPEYPLGAGIAKIRKENRNDGGGKREWTGMIWKQGALVNSEFDPAESRNSNLEGGASRELNRASSDSNLGPSPPPPPPL